MNSVMGHENPGAPSIRPSSVPIRTLQLQQGPTNEDIHQLPRELHSYDDFQTQMFRETGFLIQYDQAWIHPYQKPSSNKHTQKEHFRANNTRYHPYNYSTKQTNNFKSTKLVGPPAQPDTYGSVFEDLHQLDEYIQFNHPLSTDSSLGHQMPVQAISLLSNQEAQQQEHPSCSYDNIEPSLVLDINRVLTEQNETLKLDFFETPTHGYEKELTAFNQQKQQQCIIGVIHSVNKILDLPLAQQCECQSALIPTDPINVASQISYHGLSMPVRRTYVKSPHYFDSPRETSNQPIAGHRTTKELCTTKKTRKNNESLVAKTYNCTVCNKSFTSSQHLKRHYTTTLHKTTVKRNDLSNTVLMNTSAHHHPGELENSGQSGTEKQVTFTKPPEFSTSEIVHDSMIDRLSDRMKRPVLLPSFDVFKRHQSLRPSFTEFDINDFLTNYSLPRAISEQSTGEALNNSIDQQQGKNDVQAVVITDVHRVTSTKLDSLVKTQEGCQKCFECNKVFNRPCYLTQHNNSFHSGDKPFKCNQCGKRFALEHLYTEHMRKHVGEKPHKCEICPKQFHHKTDLKRHMCLHTGKKPYACYDCGKGFIRKDHMLKHLETHKKTSTVNSES